MENNENTNEFAKHFSEESFWEKVKNFAVKAGKKVIEKALVLYYCFLDKDTPAWAKAIILGALGYFIFPLDAIPDITPPGFTDDFGVLAAASVAIAAHIKKEHIDKAKEQLKNWFGDDEDDKEPTVTEEKK